MTQPTPQLPPDSDSGPLAEPAFTLARRSFVFLGLGALVVAGCSTEKAQQVLRTPDPVWPDVPPPPPPQAPPVGSSSNKIGAVPAGGTAVPGVPSTETLRRGALPNALARNTWARGAPTVSKMVPMLPPRWITVHHDGMTPFYGTNETETKARLEQVRNGHLYRGWGDVGYHFIIDRSGRVWEGRNLKFQGAHVQYCNENNIGVMCLGNFEEQKPSAAQLATLQKTLLALRTYYRIPMARVRTHREWPSAHTACPGINMQVRVVAMRRGDSAA